MTDTANEIRSIGFLTSSGEETTLDEFGDDLFLLVNVASKCGLTPQYETLEKLQKEYGDRGLRVIGFPCNQFLGQEPGSIEEILDYCSVTWGVSFPIMDKLRVNGRHAAPLYKALKKAPNAESARGPVMWNFEKFVLTPSGELHRFRPNTVPDAAEIIEVIEANLPR